MMIIVLDIFIVIQKVTENGGVRNKYAIITVLKMKVLIS